MAMHHSPLPDLRFLNLPPGTTVAGWVAPPDSDISLDVAKMMLKAADTPVSAKPTPVPAGDTTVSAKPTPGATAWDAPLAITMMDAADASVELYGSHGRDSRIQDLAEQVVAAHGRRDMASVKAACSQITERSKEMANHTPNREAAS